ncbi:MAG: NADH-quinone oxidoreductase subunit M [Chloroflexi bacterium]|nr:NADH-quinone oxidoreductase subunit M [Chloroflexota bacterium]
MEFNFILSTIVFLPAVGAIIIALGRGLSPRGIKLAAALFTLLAFGLSLSAYFQFDSAPGGPLFQFREAASWLPSINSQYHLGVDGLSLPLVVLTTFLGIISVLISWKINLRPREYFAWLLLLETGILGVFTSLDLLLFFLFWEVELIPMYMLISIWGSGRKEYSATKFVVYTIFGSALMLVGMLALYASAGTFDIEALAGMNLATVHTVIPLAAIFFLIFMAFAIKLPVFPFHTWLPDAHTDAPTAVSVILAGVLLKMGGYGMIRISVTLFPTVAKEWAPLLVILAVGSVLYGAAVTLRQTDLKKLIAYSSVSHMGYVLLGIFALTQVSLTGAALQMVSHGVVTGLLFAMVGVVYDHSHLRDLSKLGGLARQMPVAAVVFSIAGMASLGLPGTSGFVAEFVTFVGSFTSKAFDGIQFYTILGVVGIAVTAGYILWMLQRTFYGPPQEKFAGVLDAGGVEKVAIFSFVVAIMLLGVYPAVVTGVLGAGIAPVVRLLGG